MAKIVIKDLPDSVDLDRQAMAAIVGGARLRGRGAIPGHTLFGSERIVNYPPAGRPAGQAARGPAKK